MEKSVCRHGMTTGMHMCGGFVRLKSEHVRKTLVFIAISGVPRSHDNSRQTFSLSKKWPFWVERVSKSGQKMDKSVCRRSATAAEHRDLDQLADNPSEVQAALAEAAHWLVTLAAAIFSGQDDARMLVLHMLGARPENLSPVQRQQWESRKASMREISRKFSHAKMLPQDRGDGKRAFDDMRVAGQQFLEDFDTEGCTSGGD